MTIEEAKKAGFRSASGALYVYWHIYNGLIFVGSCDAIVLTANDFPTRAKAREALRIGNVPDSYPCCAAHCVA